jgi:DNA polymerase elongation subunit (family B)
MSDKDNVSFVNQAVEELFNEAQECRIKELRKGLKVEVKNLIDRRAVAAKVLANVDREMIELKIKVAQELEE